MSLINHIHHIFNLKKEKGWKYIYIAVDVHGTILKPSHNKNENLYEFYPFALETLQKLSQMEDICLIMNTSSFEEKQLEYQKFFKDLGVNFKYINSNPEIKNNDFACFDKKFFLDIGIDDKYGFDANKDWKAIIDYFDFVNDE